MAQVALGECYSPAEPDTYYAPELEAEYRDEIHQFYLDYFAEAQNFLNCLADERRIMSEQVNEILKSYRSFAARYPN